MSNDSKIIVLVAICLIYLWFAAKYTQKYWISSAAISGRLKRCAVRSGIIAIFWAPTLTGSGHSILPGPPMITLTGAFILFLNGKDNGLQMLAVLITALCFWILALLVGFVISYACSSKKA